MQLTKPEKDKKFWDLLMQSVLEYKPMTRRPSNSLRRIYNVPAYHFDP